MFVLLYFDWTMSHGVHTCSWLDLYIRRLQTETSYLWRKCYGCVAMTTPHKADLLQWWR